MAQLLTNNRNVATLLAASAATGMSHTGSAVETTLATVTVPGGAMGINGAVHIRTMWSFTNSANDKTLKVKFGAGTPLQYLFTTSAGVQSVTIVRNRGAANSQVGYTNSSLPYSISGAAVYTSAIDTSADVSIAFTATLESAGETITLESYEVWLTP